MPTKRTLLGAAAFSLALAGGGMAGAVLGTPSLSGAQDGTTTTTEADNAPDDGAARLHGPGRGARLETAAEALGMTAEELKAELEAGKSIAQVAEEKGVDVQDVIDALVAKGTERLEAAIAELPERVGELVEREGLPERPGRGAGHGPRGGHDGPAEGEDAPTADDAS